LAMKQTGGGSIVTTSSAAGIRAVPDHGHLRSGQVRRHQSGPQLCFGLAPHAQALPVRRPDRRGTHLPDQRSVGPASPGATSSLPRTSPDAGTSTCSAAAAPACRSICRTTRWPRRASTVLGAR
jgi:hypothetical protein